METAPVRFAQADSSQFGGTFSFVLFVFFVAKLFPDLVLLKKEMEG